MTKSKKLILAEKSAEWYISEQKEKKAKKSKDPNIKIRCKAIGEKLKKRRIEKKKKKKASR